MSHPSHAHYAVLSNLCHFLPLRSKYFPQHPVVRYPRAPSSLNVRDQVSHTYRTTNKIIVICIKIWEFVVSEHVPYDLNSPSWELHYMALGFIVQYLPPEAQRKSCTDLCLDSEVVSPVYNHGSLKNELFKDQRSSACN
jgi:hypothetical protein